MGAIYSEEVSNTATEVNCLVFKSSVMLKTVIASPNGKNVAIGSLMMVHSVILTGLTLLLSTKHCSRTGTQLRHQ